MHIEDMHTHIGEYCSTESLTLASDSSPKLPDNMRNGATSGLSTALSRADRLKLTPFVSVSSSFPTEASGLKTIFRAVTVVEGEMLPLSGVSAGSVAVAALNGNGGTTGASTVTVGIVISAHTNRPDGEVCRKSQPTTDPFEFFAALRVPRYWCSADAVVGVLRSLPTSVRIADDGCGLPDSNMGVTAADGTRTSTLSCDWISCDALLSVDELTASALERHWASDLLWQRSSTRASMPRATLSDPAVRFDWLCRCGVVGRLNSISVVSLKIFAAVGADG